MGLVSWMDERVRRLGIWDVKLAQGGAMFLALIIAKIVPQIMTVNVWWFVLAAALCAIRPVYVVFVRA
jgi:hypothetical protein